MALGNFTDGHRLPVLFLVDPARALEFGLVPTHHVVVGRQLREVEIEVARQDCHAALQRHQAVVLFLLLQRLRLAGADDRLSAEKDGAVVWIPS